MSDQRYRVTEATLVKRPGGSAWKLTFTPESTLGDPAADHHVTITISPSEVDNMFFDVTYTREEIAALTEGDSGA
jgi:hypothetical protein